MGKALLCTSLEGCGHLGRFSERHFLNHDIGMTSGMPVLNCCDLDLSCATGTLTPWPVLAWDVSKDGVDYELGLTTEQADRCRWIGITFLSGAVGFERQILENRKRVHEAARPQNPSQWSRAAKDWTPVEQEC